MAASNHSSCHLFLFFLLSFLITQPALTQDPSVTTVTVNEGDPFIVPTTLANQTTPGYVETTQNTPPETGLSTPTSGGDNDDEDVPPVGGTRCQGYYDFRQQRLDQRICSNYDTPIWANTGKPVATITEGQGNQDRDRTHLIVYIICGVVAIMVLVGIFTKLGLEKSRGGSGGGGAGAGHADLNSRTLTDLLKQQGGEVSSVENAAASSPSGGRANGNSARMLRSRSEQYHLNNSAYGPFGQGLPHPHSNHSTVGLNKYTSLKAVAHSATSSYYKSYPLMDFSQYQPVSPPGFQPVPVQPKDKSYIHQPVSAHHDLHAPLSISIPSSHLEHPRLPKTTTQPELSSSAFKAWEPTGRHVHRQASAPGAALPLCTTPTGDMPTRPGGSRA
ncbi:Protein shisa-9 Precursor [Larimichthys crocea]|uniref:Protein shisa-9 n=1 Tax=Larimichthys crocea TaxID=215358 RepID=A0A6G0HZ93_LARCR|nr:Protein shisa-9 Precursor [Larimichthys crocea]